jgi:hypothetical protein
MEAAVAFVSLEVVEPPFKVDRKSFLVKGLLRWGFLGSRIAYPFPSSTSAIEEDSSISS